MIRAKSNLRRLEEKSEVEMKNNYIIFNDFQSGTTLLHTHMELTGELKYIGVK